MSKLLVQSRQSLHEESLNVSKHFKQVIWAEIDAALAFPVAVSSSRLPQVLGNWLQMMMHRTGLLDSSTNQTQGSSHLGMKFHQHDSTVHPSWCQSP